MTPQKRAKVEQFGPYTIEGDVVYCQSSDDESVRVMRGVPRVQAMIVDPDSGYFSYLIEVQSPAGESFKFRAESLSADKAKIVKKLEAMGCLVYKRTLVSDFLLHQIDAGNFKAKEARILLTRPGWLPNGGFCTGSDVILPHGQPADGFWVEPAAFAPVAVNGTRDEWRQEIGKHIEANPMALTMACSFLASPLLPLVDQSSRLVNFWGQHGSGKTLLEQCAASLFGNGVDPAAGRQKNPPAYISKFATTVNGVEPLLARFSPLALALDEATEQDGGTLLEIGYKLASGQGKHRLTSHGAAALTHEWQLIIVTTAERQLCDVLGGQGKPVLGGWADRVIDIPVDGLGAWTNWGDFPSFKKLARHLKGATARYFGAAGRAYLEYLVNQPDAVQERLCMVEEIEAELLPPGCGDGERRVVQLFALAVAAGWLAIDAGVLQCSEADVLAAFIQVTQAWSQARGGALHRVARWLRDEEDRWVFEAPTLHKADRIFLHQELVIIPRQVFDVAFAYDADKLIRELVGKGALKREQEVRYASRYCNNRLYCYVIFAEKIAPLVDALVEDGTGEGDTREEDHSEDDA